MSGKDERGGAKGGRHQNSVRQRLDREKTDPWHLYLLMVANKNEPIVRYDHLAVVGQLPILAGARACSDINGQLSDPNVAAKIISSVRIDWFEKIGFLCQHREFFGAQHYPPWKAYGQRV